MTLRAIAVALVAALSLAACAGPRQIYQSGVETVSAETVQLPERWFVFAEAETPGGDASIRRGLAAAVAIVDEKIATEDNVALGPPVIDRLRARPGGRAAFRAGRFVRKEPSQPLIGLAAVRYPPQEAIRFDKTGPINSSPAARRAMALHLRELGRLPVGPAFLEAYEGDTRHAIVQPVAPIPTRPSS